VRVALGHINRIETPFQAFDIWTESPEEFEQRGHVFYVSPQTGAHPRCRNVGGVSASFAAGQRFIGSAFEVFVGVAHNGAAIAKAFDEQWCAGPDVAAVALWPSPELAPGARAEIVVVRRRAPVTERPVRMRASLVE
jgi:conjugal transfer pilus assembly protein TraK